jgi:hypothetical protein
VPHCPFPLEYVFYKSNIKNKIEKTKGYVGIIPTKTAA